MELLNKKIFNIEFRKILFLLGMLFLTLYSFNLFYSIVVVIKNFMTGKIFNHDILNNSIEEITEAHAILLSLGFALTLWLIFRKNVSVLSLVVLSLVSANGLYPFLDNVVHPFFMKLGIFDYFLRPGAKDLNPQYTRMTLFLIATMVLSLIVCVKKNRTIDRSFGLIISWVVVITTFLFHIAIPMGMLKYTKSDRLNDFIVQSYEAPKEYYCKDKTCAFYDKDFNEIKEKFSGNEQLLSNYSGFVNEAKSFFSKPENRKFPIYGNDGNFIGITANFFVCHVHEEGYFCAIKENAMKDYGRQSQLWFAFLTSAAHFVWLFFGLLLLALHKNRKIRCLSSSN